LHCTLDIPLFSLTNSFHLDLWWRRYRRVWNRHCRL